MQTIFYDVLSPVVLGIYTSIRHSISGIGYFVLFSLGRFHLAIGWDTSLHVIVNITIDERGGKTCAYSHLTHFYCWWSVCAANNHINIDTTNASPYNKSLLQMWMVIHVAVYHLGIISGLLYNIYLRWVECAIFVGGVVKVYAVATNDIWTVCGSHLTDSPVVANGNTDEAVRHFCFTVAAHWHGDVLC